MKLFEVITASVDWNTKPEVDQITAVKRDCDVIKYIDNPSEKVQLAAVSHYAGSLHAIHDKGIRPSDDVLIAAINQSADIFRFVVKYFSPISEVVQLVGVAANSWNIGEIADPGEVVQMTAVKQHYMAILNIKKPLPSVIKTILTTPLVIKNEADYNKMVRHLFANNAILMKKWLRYGETMRYQR
jgi:hypothetical protein